MCQSQAGRWLRIAVRRSGGTFAGVNVNVDVHYPSSSSSSSDRKYSSAPIVIKVIFLLFYLLLNMSMTYKSSQVEEIRNLDSRTY